MRNFLSLLVLAVLLVGCSSQAVRPLPELPRKDWLNTDDTAKTASVTFDAEKIYGFRDLVYLAIQHSPALARSAVNLDIQQIASNSAKWKALPEIHLIATISNNITQYNKGTTTESDYGDTKYQISYSGVFNNPVATYFDIQAQDDLMQIAMATHKQVIGQAITQIASLMVQIHAKEQSIETLQQTFSTAQKNKNFSQTTDEFGIDAWGNKSVREDAFLDINLQIDSAKIELATLRNRLKLITGIDRKQALKIETASILKEINAFDPTALSWEKSWDKSITHYLVKQQVRLHDAGIMLAWAQYVPSISLYVNESAPNGESQDGGETDQFLHVSLSFPLLDWGYRYRNAEQARARKRQSRLDEIIQRREYEEHWYSTEEQLLLAKARLRQRAHAEKTAERRLQTVRVSFENARATFPELANAEYALQEARQAHIAAQAAVLQCKLEWMSFSQVLQNTFLDPEHDGTSK